METGLVRAVTPGIQHERSPEWFYSEITLDTGQTYKFFNLNKSYLDDLAYLIDQEVKYTVDEKMRIKLYELPPPPKRRVSPSSGTVESSETYWRKKDSRDAYREAIYERQYYITLAKEFVIPLGRMTDANWEEKAEQALQLGIEWHEKYGKLKFDE